MWSGETSNAMLYRPVWLLSKRMVPYDALASRSRCSARPHGRGKRSRNSPPFQGHGTGMPASRFIRNLDASATHRRSAPATLRETCLFSTTSENYRALAGRPSRAFGIITASNLCGRYRRARSRAACDLRGRRERACRRSHVSVGAAM